MKWMAYVLFFSIMITGCNWFDDDDEKSTGGTGGSQVVAPAVAPAPSPETPAPAESEAVQSDKYDHYNPQAWEGRGSAIVLCKGSPRMDSCSIEGRDMRLHGSQDHGRYVWTVYNKSGLGGTIVCKNGAESYAYEVSGSGGMQYGNCN